MISDTGYLCLAESYSLNIYFIIKSDNIMDYKIDESINKRKRLDFSEHTPFTCFIHHLLSCIPSQQSVDMMKKFNDNLLEQIVASDESIIRLIKDIINSIFMDWLSLYTIYY